MKKKLLYLTFFLSLLGLCTVTVEAKDMSANDVEGNSYVIGTHIFTGNTTLTTSHIMLAAKTTESNNIEDMVIYYKTPRGSWINGATGESLTEPESFKINYTDLKLEEDNDTVSAPKKPILVLDDIWWIDYEKDEFTYLLSIFIDDVEDKSNKVSGVELSFYDSAVDQGAIKVEDLKYDEIFSGHTAIPNEEYKGKEYVEVGKEYHYHSIRIEKTPLSYYGVRARAYVEDENGKKVYSDYVEWIKIEKETTFPFVEIINNYSNPDYLAIEDNYIIYKLGVKIPDAYESLTEYERRNLIYRTNCAEGIFLLDQEFIMEVPKETIKTCYAQMGYIYNDGYKWFNDSSAEEKDYFTIDTRTLTAPVLSHAYYGRSAVRIGSDFYERQDENTLDYHIEGIELYRVNPGFELVLVDPLHTSIYEVTPPLPGEIGGGGIGYYTARAYATNALGKKVYSEYSNIVAVVQTPEIEVSDVIDGKVNVRIKNIDDYFYYDNILKYNVYVDNYLESEMLDLDETATVNIDSTSRIYVRVYIKEEGAASGTNSEDVTIVIE